MQIIPKIKCFINRYKSKGIIYSPEKDEWKKLTKIIQQLLFMFYMLKKLIYILPNFFFFLKKNVFTFYLSFGHTKMFSEVVGNRLFTWHSFLTHPNKEPFTRKNFYTYPIKKQFFRQNIFSHTPERTQFLLEEKINYSCKNVKVLHFR